MNVLIVEDDPMIAAELAHAVAGARHHVIGMAATRSEALALADRHGVDAALVDLSLADGFTGERLAQDLEARRIAVAFLTGHAERLSSDVVDQPVLDKPYFDGAVRAVLDRLQTRRRVLSR